MPLSSSDTSGKFKVEFQLSGTRVHYSMSAPTAGWLSLGLNNVALMGTPWPSQI